MQQDDPFLDGKAVVSSSRSAIKATTVTGLKKREDRERDTMATTPFMQVEEQSHAASPGTHAGALTAVAAGAEVGHRVRLVHPPKGRRGRRLGQVCDRSRKDGGRGRKDTV